MNCIDCNKASSKKLCIACLKVRNKCARGNCKSKIRPNEIYTCCYNCTCATKGCRNGREVGESLYCEACLSAWDVRCYICDRPTLKPFKTCTECDCERKQCETCKDHKAVFNVRTQTSLKYCRQCKCKTPECGGAKETTKGCCIACEICYCIVCKATFARIGSDKCARCFFAK